MVWSRMVDSGGTTSWLHDRWWSPLRPMLCCASLKSARRLSVSCVQPLNHGYAIPWLLRLKLWVWCFANHWILLSRFIHHNQWSLITFLTINCEPLCQPWEWCSLCFDFTLLMISRWFNNCLLHSVVLQVDVHRICRPVETQVLFPKFDHRNHRQITYKHHVSNTNEISTFILLLWDNLHGNNLLPSGMLSHGLRVMISTEASDAGV